MKYRITAVAACAALTLMLTSCATVFKGKYERLEVGSQPAGAHVYVNGLFMGATPAVIRVDGTRDLLIEMRKDSVSKTATIRSSVGGGWIALDVLCGLLPVVVDGATGNWNSLDQSQVFIVF